MRYSFFYFIFLVLLPFSPHLKAQSSFELSSGFQHFKYKEFNDVNETLNKETGFLPGVQAAAIWSNDYLLQSVSSSIYSATINYDGQTQTGIKYQTDSNATQYRLSYLLTIKVPETRYSFFTKINWDHWNRSIQPTNNVLGLYEEYSWPSINLGLAYEFKPLDKHSFNFGMSYVHIFEGKFEIDFKHIGFGDEQLDLGRGKGIESTFSYRFEFDPELSAGFSLYYRSWNFEKSAPATISNGTRTITFLEPRSKSRLIGLSVNFLFDI